MSFGSFRKLEDARMEHLIDEPLASLLGNYMLKACGDNWERSPWVVAAPQQKHDRLLVPQSAPRTTFGLAYTDLRQGIAQGRWKSPEVLYVSRETDGAWLITRTGKMTPDQLRRIWMKQTSRGYALSHDWKPSTVPAPEDITETYMPTRSTIMGDTRGDGREYMRAKVPLLDALYHGTDRLRTIIKDDAGNTWGLVK